MALGELGEAPQGVPAILDPWREVLVLGPSQLFTLYQ